MQSERTRRDGRRGRWVVGVAVAFAAAALGTNGTGCASSDARLRESAPDLVEGRWQEEALHCSRGRCVQMFRVVVEKPTTLVVEADAPADPLLPDFFLVLEDPQGNPIGDDREAQKRPRRIVRSLDPGLYFVRVGGQDEKGDLLSYKLRVRPRTVATRKPVTRTSPPPARPTPPSPPPAPVYIESELLEVERDGGEPVAILIEAGTSQGLVPGQSGELVEGGRVIGRIEVVDVYAAGSRARIIGGLRAPITLDTRARVQK
jgi:hypothetical protein